MIINVLYKGSVIFQAEKQRIDDKLIVSISDCFTNHTQTRDYELYISDSHGWQSMRMPNITISEDDRRKLIAESLSEMTNLLKKKGQRQ